MEVFHKPDLTDDDQASKKRKRTEPAQAQIHSKIEKRRRDKMNSYITQLSTMIPMMHTCNPNAPKLDKISVIKMTVQYLKSIRVSPMQFNSRENLKYSFINDLELKSLMTRLSDGFLFVVGCESARISYVSQSASDILKCNSSDLLGCSLYDVIHPHDMDKVKEQISCVDLNPTHQLISTKASKNLEVDVPSEQLGLHPGNRRSFFFRIKNRIGDHNKYSANNNTCPFNGFENTDENDRFTIIQCNGYLKCCNSTNYTPNMGENSEDTTQTTSFVAIGRPITAPTPNEQRGPITFTSKHTVDGKFLFVDHGATEVTGYLPQEILNTNIYDYIHTDDINDVATTHQSMLQFPSSTIVTNNYRIRTKYGTYVKLQSEWKGLVNPWKKEIEFYYSKNTTILCLQKSL